MTTAEISVLPARPDSVAEWEDLLVRLEIAARAVRVTLEEVGEEESARRALEAAAVREAEVARSLEAAAGLPESDPAALRDAGADLDVATLALRFASLRARNFAMVQRRGLDVWNWTAPLNGGAAGTVYQLLSWLAQQDARLLTELRSARATGRS